MQGQYNNPFFKSGYNYHSTWDAARTIVRQEGLPALFHGYKATIFRDLPFSALQFAFYEQERNWAKRWVGSSDIGLGLEIITAASAGGLAGTITCPLDVVKTITQTQLHPLEVAAQSQTSQTATARVSPHESSFNQRHTLPQVHRPRQLRYIATSSPNTTLRSDSTKLETSSILTGLRSIYKTEGIAGLFRGVGPRAVWTSVQSGTMLVLYQLLLKQMAEQSWFNGSAPWGLGS